MSGRGIHSAPPSPQVVTSPQKKHPDKRQPVSKTWRCLACGRPVDRDVPAAAGSLRCRGCIEADRPLRRDLTQAWLDAGARF